MKLLTFRPKPSLAPGLLALALAGGHAAQAQAVLSLTPITSTTTVGSTVTITVNLTGGTNLQGYNINVLLNPAQFQFVGSGSSLFTHSDGALFQFPLPPQVNAAGSDLNFSAGNIFTPYPNNTGITPLGTFSVKVLSALPLTGGALSFGPLGAYNSSGFAGTSVTDGNTNEITAATGATLFTPAPEPSQTAALGLGVLGLAGLALRARKARHSA